MRVLCLITMALLSTVALNQVSAAPQFFNRVGNFFRGVRDFPGDFSNGVREMNRAYEDMRERNVIGSDQYYHARGNRDAAAHGLGGRFAASIISNGREVVNVGEAIVGRKSDSNSGGGNDGYVHDRFSDAIADSARDQEANLAGRNGGNIDVYRVNGMEGHN